MKILKFLHEICPKITIRISLYSLQINAEDFVYNLYLCKRNKRKN